MLQKVKILFLLLFLCLVSGDLFARRYTIEQYIDSFAPVAMNLKKKTGIPASVILGVAIVESGFGNSKNCVLLKNHFGIIGRNQLRANGIPYRSHYKQYESDSASYRDFCRVVSSKHYYAKLKNRRPDALWLKHISKTYAAARKKWVTRILLVIKKYRLDRFNI